MNKHISKFQQGHKSVLTRIITTELNDQLFSNKVNHDHCVSRCYLYGSFFFLHNPYRLQQQQQQQQHLFIPHREIKIKVIHYF